MDQAIRNKLRGVVTQCRKLLEDSVSQELQGKFGIYAEKKDAVQVDDDARMSHLNQEERASRKDILDHFDHIKARGFKRKEALDQLIREIAYTHLNRLCAYKMMEARQVYIADQRFREAVNRGVNSNAVKFYLADHPDDERFYRTGKQDIAYRHFLDWLGGLLSEEIGVLFSPDNSANQLYPTQKVLDEVLLLLNDEALVEIWTQDETIGWIYQYFTPKELRDRAHKESDAPGNSYELAFRNQFYTPRYVVEFLTDNTLGRIWYEMRKGESKLKDQCRYMVRRPTEVFVADGQPTPKEVAEGGDGQSQDELLNEPVYVPHRQKKDPRELKVLDPACGSGHFLLYCFDVFQTIYEEAYDDPDLGPALKKDYATLVDLKKAVPGLILNRNLHGIDIDLRSTQIASLALWLRCQRAFQDMGLKKDRPKITRANLVCAEPMPGGDQLLREFVGGLEPKLLGQLVEAVFEKMKIAGEAGSLLKVEEEMRYTLAEAKRLWVRESTRAVDHKGHPLLFSEGVMERLKNDQVAASHFDFSDITDDQFFQEAESKVIEELRRYGEKAENGHRLQRRLFFEDAVRGFAFVDLCRLRYDAVLMNPPFGSATKDTLGWFREQYPEAAENLSVGEILQSLKRLCPGGMVGLIGDLPWLQQATYAKFRSRLVRSRSLQFFVELGWGILGTDVEVALAVFNSQESPLASFSSLVGVENQKDALIHLFKTPRHQCLRRLSEFLVIENHPFAYQISDRALNAFKHGLRLTQVLFEAAGGVAASDADRVFRCWWEVKSDALGRNNTWAFCQNGSPYSPFYYPTYFSIRSDNGTFEVIKSYPNARTPNAERYWQPGLAYGKRTGEMYCYPMPAEQVITWEGQALFPETMQNVWHALALGNSTPYSMLANLVAGQHKYAGYLNTICMDISGLPDLSASGRRVYSLIREIDSVNELSHSFDPKALVHALNQEPSAWPATLDNKEKEIALEIGTIDQAIFSATSEGQREARRKPSGGSYFAAITDAAPSGRTICELITSMLLGCVFGRWDIRFILGAKKTRDLPDPFAPLGACPPAMLQGRDGLPLAAMPDGYPIRVACEGIVVDDLDHPDDINRRLLDALEVIWKDEPEIVEKQLCETLGVSELRDYFRKPGKGGFWADHVARYSKSRRKAPIYWLLQSSKKSYAFWLHYHRLDKDLLFKILVNYVEPKIQRETNRVDDMRRQKQIGASSKMTKTLDKEIERQEDLISEIRDFEDKLRRAASLHLQPDLNDGVVLNVAPLHELVPWKEAKNYWDELVQGKYGWSSIGKQLRQNGIVK